MNLDRIELERLEKVAIGAVLMDNTNYDDFSLTPADFAFPRNRAAYQVIKGLIESGEEANTMSLYSKVKDSDLAGEYLREPGNPAYAAREIRRESKRRRLQMLSAMINESVSEAEPGETVDMIHRELDAIDDSGRTDFSSLRELVIPTINQIETWRNDRDARPGVLTGYSGLDTKLGGFEAGEYIVLAARTSIGKTEFVVNMVTNQIAKGIPIGLFSAEMSASRIVTRMLCSQGRMKYGLVRYGFLRDSDFSKLSESAEKLYNQQAFIDDTPGIAFSELRSKARRMVRTGARMIYVDYLTLVRYGDARMPRHERVGELSKAFQRLARELSIPILVLSQLNRQGEGQRPTLDQLRQSGEIEEDADLIMFLHRDRDKTDAELIIAKSRDGASGKVLFHYFPDKSRYEEAIEHE